MLYSVLTRIDFKIVKIATFYSGVAIYITTAIISPALLFGGLGL